MTTPFHHRLALRLAEGISTLPESDRAKTAAFILDRQDKNGSFCGRRGVGDLYYTGFALRGLALLGEMNQCNRNVVLFLKTCLERNDLDCVDLITLLNSAVILELTWGENLFTGISTSPQDWMLENLQKFRASDGGFAASPKSHYSSTYHNFLVLSTMQLFGLEDVQTPHIVRNTLLRQRDDGGFVELPPLKYSGTNPTAAAVCQLGMLGIRDDPINDAKRFLLSMLSDNGGFRANSKIPVPDLLSTFTAIVALEDLDALDGFNTKKALQFVDSLRHDCGGTVGGSWDREPDVEYTFYALATQAFLG